MYDTAEYIVTMQSKHGGFLKLRRDGFRYSVDYWFEGNHHLVQGGFATKHDALQFMMKECV